jgi:hypothetical protein
MELRNKTGNPCLFQPVSIMVRIKSSLQVLLGAKPPLKPRWCYLKLSMVPPASTATRIYINCSVVPDSTLCLGMQDRVWYSGLHFFLCYTSRGGSSSFLNDSLLPPNRDDGAGWWSDVVRQMAERLSHWPRCLHLPKRWCRLLSEGGFCTGTL